MFDMLMDQIFKQLNMTPEEVKSIGERVVSIATSADERLKRIEEKLGIQDAQQ